MTSHHGAAHDEDLPLKVVRTNGRDEIVARTNNLLVGRAAAQADGYTMMAAAITLGVAVPALVYALTRVGAGLWIDCPARV